MSSRSPSLPEDGDVDFDGYVVFDPPSFPNLSDLFHELPCIRSRRRLPGPTAASMPTASTPVDPKTAPISTTATPVDPKTAPISTTATPVDLFRFSTGGPSYASVVRSGLPTVPKPQPQQESGSESDLELDSPPRLTSLTMLEDEDYELDIPTSLLTMLEDKDDELDIPTSLGGSSYDELGIPTSRCGSPCGSTPSPPVLPTFGSEEWEDLYFKSMVDNFISAVDVYKSTLPEDTICKEADHQLQSNRYAMSALKHYNNNEHNKVKYELIDAITSNGMFDMNDGYGHVNFTAKADQKNSKEELFFAELRFHDNDYITTCVLSLEGEKSIGGLCGSKYDNRKNGCFIDAKHCYACERELKHPKNGALYESGHIADSEYYHG